MLNKMVLAMIVIILVFSMIACTGPGKATEMPTHVTLPERVPLSSQIAELVPVATNYTLNETNSY